MIETAQQFFTWFEDAEAQLESDQEHAFKAYLELLQQYSGRCDAMLHEIDTALHHLAVSCLLARSILSLPRATCAAGFCVVVVESRRIHRVFV